MAVVRDHAVKVLSPEILSLWECAEALFIAEGHTARRVRGECRVGARGRSPVRVFHHAMTATREIHGSLPRGSMPIQAEEARTANGAMEVGSLRSTDEAWQFGWREGGDAITASREGTGRTQRRGTSGPEVAHIRPSVLNVVAGSRMRERRKSGSERGRGAIVAQSDGVKGGWGDSLNNTREAGGGSLTDLAKKSGPTRRQLGPRGPALLTLTKSAPAPTAAFTGYAQCSADPSRAQETLDA